MRAKTGLEIRKAENIERMRGQCHRHTANRWAEILQVEPSTIRRYAEELGEKLECGKHKPANATGLPRSRRPVPIDKTEVESAGVSMMASWARRPIR